MKKTFVPRLFAHVPRHLLFREAKNSLLCAFAVCFVLFACAARAIPLHNEPVVPLCDSIVRLRVVANAQNERDNRTKLAVRDALLENAPVWFGNCRSVESARLAIRTNLFSIEKIAQEAVRDSGSTDDARVHFGYERAPVRRYGAYTFPADEYLTLRVDIGRADGRNWWCVLYPPLCLAGAEGGASDTVALDREVFLSYGFTSEQLDALQYANTENRKNDGKPVIRSAVIEFFCKFFD